jgi:REP element-mobilizing transposase RayT
MAGKYLSLLVHFTWSTARREPWLQADMRDDLYSYIGGIMKKKNAKLISAGGMLITFTYMRRCRRRSASRIL